MRRLIKYREDDQLSFYKKHIRKLIISLVFLISSTVLFSCLEGAGNLPNSITTNPFGLQIIFPNANPDLIFGNLCDLVELEVLVNRELTPNGSLVQYELNSATLPLSKRGNIVSFTGPIVDGRAFAQYLAGLVRLGDEVFSIDSITSVNIGVTITTPAGDSQSDFATVFINPISIAAVEESLDVEANPDPMFCTDQGQTPNQPVTVTLQFDTVGIPTTPNTGSLTQAAVDILVSNPAIGMVNDPTPPIVGTTNLGLITIQYTAIDNTQGTQVITAVITLPDPADKFPELPSIPLSERQLTAQIIITQTVGTQCFESSEGGGGDNDPVISNLTTDTSIIAPGGSQNINVTTSNVQNGTQMCCEITQDTTPAASTMIAVGSMNPPDNCVGVNANIASFQFQANAGVVTPDSAQYQCCLVFDNSGVCPLSPLPNTIVNGSVQIL